jgi:hypothetical protein
MELFDLIGQLRSYAASQGWGFAAGDNFYQNIEVANQTLTAGQLVLTAEFNTSPSIVNGRVVQVTYSGSIMLGRKQDFDGQQSTLDETYIQKYDRRLLELMTLLANAIGDFTCTNELEITAIEFVHSINTFNTNIDFVGGNITIVQ